MKEKQYLQEDLQQLHEEMDVLKGDIAKVRVKEDEQNLGDELGISDPLAINASPACEPSYLKIQEGKSHRKLMEKQVWKLKLVQLEKSISSEKLKITCDILNLKEKEYSETKMLGCKCKTYCRIMHNKHNWKKSISQEDKAYNIESCLQL